MCYAFCVISIYNSCRKPRKFKNPKDDQTQLVGTDTVGLSRDCANPLYMETEAVLTSHVQGNRMTMSYEQSYTNLDDEFDKDYEGFDMFSDDAN